MGITRAVGIDAASAVVLAGFTVWVGAPVAVAAATCQGQEATLVGTPGKTLNGTPGDDVIVSNSAWVLAGAGNDLICLTGSGWHVANAGPGDDAVDNASGDSRVALGVGVDEFTGGSGVDTVDVDVVTGGVVDDQVVLGAGNDELVLSRPTSSPTANLDGGPGIDSLGFDNAPQVAGAWSFDNRSGRATNGSESLRWSSLEEFSLNLPAASRVSFTGSDVAEYLYGFDNLGTIALAGGNDYVRGGLAAPASWNGGAGVDEMLVLGLGNAVHNMQTGVIRGPEGYLQVAQFETVDVEAIELKVYGTQGADNIDVRSCKATVRAKGGADVVRARGVYNQSGSACSAAPRAVLYGGGGNDRLIGATGRDRLYGQDGFDRVDGRASRDLCRTAERKRRCER